MSFNLTVRYRGTGKDAFAANEQAEYESRPEVSLLRRLYGNSLLVQVKDRQDFELKAFDARDGKLLHAIAVKAACWMGCRPIVRG